MSLRIALVTAREALPVDQDLPPLIQAVNAAGAVAETPCWDDPSIDWSRYALAVLRSTWDYAERIDEFLAWAARCSSQTRLLNAPALVRWNTDKHYLLDLARAGVPVVPTRFVEPGQGEPAARLDEFLDGGAQALHAGHCGAFDEFVVKPAVGAGSRDVARYHRSDCVTALAHLQRLVSQQRSTMLQPYLGRVDQHGETAVIYLGERFSHAIRKGPLLKLGAGLVAGLFAPEQITIRVPDTAEFDVAAAAYAAIPGAPPPYARIDLIRGDDGRPVVLELELAEPSLFFVYAAGSADRFAKILVERASS